MRFLEPWCMPCLESRTQSRAQDTLTQQQGNGKNRHLMCWTTLAQFTLCQPKTHTCGLSWNESGYTKAKLKTSPGVAKIMFPPCAWISALLLGVSTTFSSPNSAVKVGDQCHPHCSPPVSVATRNISRARLESSGP